ncbi:1-aminocyclopropane-1-carboxylate oxidase 1-like [Canna indica]|uniref:1-aminocyclopropane-1-carboxylate oxidase n=1 Tax=Canna indica TaxID=4628 RepID=A0AAQ3KHI7_9LILI|nr:1-aminocyclopropane-1-carboxylate oxidase 1-like [Canna indica]
MEIPVINLDELDGEKRGKTMSLLHEACEKWGFFWLDNHGIDEGLMEKVKEAVNQHYEMSMKESFYNSEMAKALGPKTNASDVDWESSFFYRHQPDCNFDDVPSLVRKPLQEFVEQQAKLAEKLSELLSENLGLEKNHLKNAFSDPFIGTKVAKYPKCSKPEHVMGLRGHTDAGGIILLLQDDKVPGLEFMKDGEWLPIPPTEGHKIFVNLGDQVEVVSNGIYKSVRHRVLADKDGSRLSIATFYNPGADAIISPAPKLVYPSRYRFQDYLNYYTTVKFSDKAARFRTIKQMFV